MNPEAVPLPANRDDAIRAMRANRDRIARLQALDLQFAAHIADLYSCVDEDDSGPVLPGSERLVQKGHDGTPEVAEFCTLEIGAALGIRNDEAELLMSEALDVRHRLPSVWRMLDSGVVKAWQARKLARITGALDLPESLELDARLAAVLPGMAWTKAEPWVRAMVLELMPTEAAEALHAVMSDRRGVWMEQSRHGVTSLTATVDAGDAIVLDA